MGSSLTWTITVSWFFIWEHQLGHCSYHSKVNYSPGKGRPHSVHSETGNFWDSKYLSTFVRTCPHWLPRLSHQSYYFVFPLYCGHFYNQLCAVFISCPDHFWENCQQLMEQCPRSPWQEGPGPICWPCVHLLPSTVLPVELVKKAPLFVYTQVT